MQLEPDAAYRALVARDPRFDGTFFVGVRSTGIYCRPVCPAQTPRREHCSFYPSGAAAERAGFRPCLRCRPELAPGGAPMDATQRVVVHALAHLDEGAWDAGGAAGLARRVGVGERQLRRAFAARLGVSPRELHRARRLALARQLLLETALPLDEVAAASGFASLRRFQAAVREAWGTSASALRRGRAADEGHVELALAHRPPLDVAGLLRFLREQRLPGVERVDETGYRRVVRCCTPSGDTVRGELEVRAESRTPGRLVLRLDAGLLPAVRPVLARVRRLFDLDAEPTAIDAALTRDAELGALARATPGTRVPGAFDPFEVALHAVLSQAVSVRCAEVFCARVVERFGEPWNGSEGLTRFVPLPEAIARAELPELRSVGLTGARARTLRAVAELALERTELLEPGAEPDERERALLALPGVGPWTVAYLALRLGDPDAFPAGDLGLRRALESHGRRPSARELEARSGPWRPWRAYAALHLWHREAARAATP